MRKKYVVRLSDEERRELTEVVRTLKGTSQKVRRAQVLLKADADGPNWTAQRITDAFSCRTKTVENIRQRLVERGFRETLDGGKPSQPPVPKRLNGKQEAQVIALRLGPPPKAMRPGRSGSWRGRLWSCGWLWNCGWWTRSVMKPSGERSKNGMTNRKIEYWVIPPEADAEFVASMEDVLETYSQPSDFRCPVLCMDEQPVQLLKETWTPIPATAGASTTSTSGPARRTSSCSPNRYVWLRTTTHTMPKNVFRVRAQACFGDEAPVDRSRARRHEAERAVSR